MKPRERMINALNFTEPDDTVASWDIEFHLYQQLLGKTPIVGMEFDKLSEREKERAVNKNAEIFIETAEKLDVSAICALPGYWENAPGIPAVLWIREPKWRSAQIKACKDAGGDKYFIIAVSDSTVGIPPGNKLEEFAVMLYEQPDEFVKLLEIRLQAGIDEGMRAAEQGADALLNASDIAFNTGCFFSPDQFDVFIGPYLERWASRFKREGLYTIYHTDGNIERIMKKLAATGISALQCIDPIAGMDIVKLKDEYYGKITLIGNVDTRTLELGTDEEIENECRYILEGCKNGGGFVFGSCNAIHAGIPLEKYMLMVDAKRKYGCLRKNFNC